MQNLVPKRQYQSVWISTSRKVILIIILAQLVYNANTFAKLGKKKKKLKNWLDYYSLKSERHPDKKTNSKERVTSRTEIISDEDVAKALLASCKGAHEPVLSIYDQLLSNGAFLPSPNLRLRLLRSVLGILREWTFSVLANKMGTAMVGSSYVFGGSSREQTTIANQGLRDKIASVANRYKTKVKRTSLSQSQTGPVYRGFRKIEEQLMTAPTFRPF